MTAGKIFPGKDGEMRTVSDSRNLGKFDRVFFEKKLKYPDLEERLTV